MKNKKKITNELFIVLNLSIHLFLNNAIFLPNDLGNKEYVSDRNSCWIRVKFFFLATYHKKMLQTNSLPSQSKLLQKNTL